MVERLNKLFTFPGEWDDCLIQIALAYNSPHSTTGFTPYLLTHGHEARMSVNVLLPNTTPPLIVPDSHTDYVAHLTRELKSTFRSAG